MGARRNNPEKKPPGATGRVSAFHSPRQERSRKTLQRILDAVERLLADQTLATLRLEDVLQESGVSASSFYARFTGREAFIDALFEAYTTDVDSFVKTIENADVPPLLEERVRFFIAERARRFTSNRGLLRALVLEHRLRPGRHADLIAENADRAVDVIVRFLLPCKEELGGDEPALTIRRVVFFAFAILRERILFEQRGHAQRSGLGDGQLVDEVTRMAVAYLRS